MRRFLPNILLAAVLSVLSLSAVPAWAETRSFGPFSVDTERMEVIRLDGDIGVADALNFRRALNFAPKAELVVLNSGGGIVSSGLLIADDVFTRRLSTLIPDGSRCYSACSFIFLAGVERQADGELGVHQVWNEANDAVSAQLSISDVLDVLNRFGTSMDVFTLMFRTPPDDMHVFTASEIARFGINRRQGDSIPQAEVTVQPQAPTAPPSIPLETPIATVEAQSPALANEAQTRLSAIESFARRPDRLALYAGLDFFGEDLSSLRVADAAACASACLSQAGQCRAFTYNTDDRVVRGPNCFLKARRGTADGNAVALSGELLRPADPAPAALSLGIIDPKGGIAENIDLPGGDLSRRPHPAASPQECRLACVDTQECVAFTFVKRKGECWLKDRIGPTRVMEGMVSGAKSFETFTATLIDLD